MYPAEAGPPKPQALKGLVVSLSRVLCYRAYIRGSYKGIYIYIDIYIREVRVTKRDKGPLAFKPEAPMCCDQLRAWQLP